MIELWPAIEAGIESLEKYYNKTDDSPVHIVSMCKHIISCQLMAVKLEFYPSLNICFLSVLDLNPCLKNEYFNIAWTPIGQKQACEVMEKVVC